MKKSFDDPAEILLKPEENYNVVPELVEGVNEAIHFIQIMLADKNGTLVENARNYITINVSGDAQLIGMDNGDSTDYDEYVSADGHIHTRKLFANRLIAIVKEKTCSDSSRGFLVTAASQGLPNVSIKYDGKEWSRVDTDKSVVPQNTYVPVRKIELQSQGSLKLDPSNKEVLVTAKVLPPQRQDVCHFFCSRTLYPQNSMAARASSAVGSMNGPGTSSASERMGSSVHPRIKTSAPLARSPSSRPRHRSRSGAMGPEAFTTS